MFSALSRVGRRLANLRVASKIALAIVAVSLSVVVFGAVAFSRIDGVDAAAGEMRSHWLPRSHALGQMLFLAQRFRVIEAALVMAPPEGRAGEMKTLQEIREQIAKDFAAQRALAQNDAENSAIAAIAATWSAYLEFDQRLVEFVTTDDASTASDLYRGAMRQLIHTLQDQMAKEVASDVANGSGAADRSAALGARARLDIMIMIGVAVFLGPAVGYCLWRGISTPMSALTRSMTALARWRPRNRNSLPRAQ